MFKIIDFILGLKLVVQICIIEERFSDHNSSLFYFCPYNESEKKSKYIEKFWVETIFLSKNSVTFL